MGIFYGGVKEIAVLRGVFIVGEFDNVAVAIVFAVRAGNDRRCGVPFVVESEFCLVAHVEVRTGATRVNSR